MALIALLCSPLLGPASWQPVADALRQLGRESLVVTAGDDAPASANAALRGYVEGLPEDTDLVVVPHSNAGLYVPGLIKLRRVVTAVYVDATVPLTDAGPVRMEPPEYLAMIRVKAAETGLVPVWTQWWDDDDLAPLFPDAAVRRRVEADQRQLPLSYFEDSVDVPPGWSAVPSAYLAFGTSYANELNRARSLGWPTATLPGQHLEMTVHPQAVAETIMDLLAAAAAGDANRADTGGSEHN